MEVLIEHNPSIGVGGRTAWIRDRVSIRSSAKRDSMREARRRLVVGPGVGSTVVGQGFFRIGREFAVGARESKRGSSLNSLPHISEARMLGYLIRGDLRQAQ